MQTLGELQQIQDGSLVVIHLLRSVIGAPDEHRQALVSLGLLNEGHRGKKRTRVSSGHIGKTVQCVWRANLASSRTQQLTRYIYFDAGNDVLKSLEKLWSRPPYERPFTGDDDPPHLEGEGDMSISSYYASGGPSATIKIGNGDTMRIEAQSDDYALGWATELDSSGVLQGLELLRPHLDVEAGSVVRLSDHTEHVLDSLEPLRRHNEQELLVEYFHLALGQFALTWAHESYDSEGRHELALSGRRGTLDRDFVGRFFDQTATAELKESRDELLKSTNTLLARYVS
jgi:hypothetical protein